MPSSDAVVSQGPQGQLVPAGTIAVLLAFYIAISTVSLSHLSSSTHGHTVGLVLSLLMLLASGSGLVSTLVYMGAPNHTKSRLLMTGCFVTSSQALFLLNITLFDEDTHCDRVSFLSGWLCAHGSDTSSFTMLCNMLCPLFVAMLLNGDDGSAGIIALTVCASLASLVFAACWKASVPAFMSAALYLLTALTLYCTSYSSTTQQQPLSILLRNSSSSPRSAHIRSNMLPVVVKRNDSSQSEATPAKPNQPADKADTERESSFREQAKEMRHMVANVAHDLKTPLASFMTGIDIMAEILFECKGKIDARLLTLSYVDGMLAELQQCLRNARVTNSFMMMTINRCIDYTKATKGIKLVPKYETMDLHETLLLPLGCMKNIQDKVTIEMLPIPSEICPHIISDKQWLQENLLCLLSNAAKYSSGGHVTVTVSLESVETASLIDSCDTEDANDINSSNTIRSASLVASKTAFKAVSHRIAPEPQSDSETSSHVQTSRSTATSSPRWSRLSAEHSHMIRVEVEDTGIGMDEQIMAELFSPFKQTQRLAGGTGLGLFSLAKRTDALRGQCGVCKRNDGLQGSLFWFTLPYRPDRAHSLRRSTLFGSKFFGHAQMKMMRSSVSASNLFTVDLSHRSNDSGSNKPLGDGHPTGLDVIAEEDNEGMLLTKTSSTAVTTDLADFLPTAANSSDQLVASSASHAKAEAESDEGKVHVLLVDDSPSVVKMTIMMLKRNGCLVTTADNGAVALDIIKSKVQQCIDTHGVPPLRVFDVILMDLQMPVMDGLEATRRLRQFEQAVSTSVSTVNHLVVGLSANCDDDVLNETQSVGFNDFLPKPFSLTAFFEILEGIQAEDNPL